MSDDGDTDFEVVQKDTSLNEMTTTLAEWDLSLGDFWGILVGATLILLLAFVTYQLWNHPIRKRNPHDIRSWFMKTPPPARKRLHRIILDRLWDTKSIRLFVRNQKREFFEYLLRDIKLKQKSRLQLLQRRNTRNNLL